MKKRQILIRVSDDVAKAMEKVGLKENWSINKVGEAAIKFYLKARRIIKE